MRTDSKKPRPRRLAVAAIAMVGLAAALIATPSLADTLTADNSETADHKRPKPLYKDQFADPAVTWTGEEMVGVSTGPKAPMITGRDARGPWKYRHGGLRDLPKWSSGGGVWAPEIRHVKGDTWVMYYATKVTGLVDDNQRCIGVAVSNDGPHARYKPVSRKPLVCPPGSDHPGYSKPVTGGVGFIDPSTFITKSGKHVLLFKSQRPDPGTKLWSVKLDSTWTKPVSSSKVLLSRPKGQIENPEMVVHNGKYYLFASYDNWADCSYKTVWLKNDHPRFGWKFSKGFPKKTTSKGGTLIKSNRGMCGTGGMTITRKDDRIKFFMHAYRDDNHDGRKDSKTRLMYGGTLKFSKTIPRIKYFDTPR